MRGSIVHVVSSTRLERGGPSLSVTQLIENLESLGQSCILVSPDHVCGSDEFAQVRSRTCKSIDELRTLVPSPSIVGLHIHGIWDLELHRATAYARKHKLPYAISPHGKIGRAHV